MGRDLDIDDVCNGNVSAEKDLLEIRAVTEKYRSLMIDMAKMYFFLRESNCINVPEPEDDDDCLLEQYKDLADKTCDEIRSIMDISGVTNA